MAKTKILGSETTEAYMKRKGLKPGDVIGAAGDNAKKVPFTETHAEYLARKRGDGPTSDELTALEGLTPEELAELEALQGLTPEELEAVAAAVAAADADASTKAPAKGTAKGGK